MTHRLFMIDDNPGDIELVTEALREGGSKVSIATAADGDEALAELAALGTVGADQLPDLILLDLNMIKVQGQEVLHRIKADPLLRCIPVVVYTSSQAAADIDCSYRDGAAAYLIKPLSFDELVRLMKTLAAFWFTAVALPRGGR